MSIIRKLFLCPCFILLWITPSVSQTISPQATLPLEALFDAGMNGWFSAECTSPAVPPNADTHKVEYLWQGAGASRELIQRVIIDQSKPAERLQRRVEDVTQLAPDLFRFSLVVLPKTTTSPVIKTLRRITANEHVVIDQVRIDANGKETQLTKDGKAVTGDSPAAMRSAQPVKPSKRCTLSETQAGALSGMAVQAPIPQSATTTAQKGPVKSVQVPSPDGFSTDFPWGTSTCQSAGNEREWGVCTVLDDAVKPLPLPAIVFEPLGGLTSGNRTSKKTDMGSEPLLIKQLQFGRVIKAPDSAWAFMPITPASSSAPSTTTQLQAGDVFGYRVPWQNLSRYASHQPEVRAVLETPRGITLHAVAGQFAYGQAPKMAVSRELQEEERLRKKDVRVTSREFPLPHSMQAQTRSSYSLLAAKNDDAMLSQSHSYFQVEPTDPAGRYVLQVWAGLKLLGAHTFEVIK